MRREDSLEKTKIVGKLESSSKRGKANIRWIGSIKVPMIALGFSGCPAVF